MTEAVDQRLDRLASHHKSGSKDFPESERPSKDEGGWKKPTTATRSANGVTVVVEYRTNSELQMVKPTHVLT